MEEFRPVLVDSVVTTIARKRMAVPDDFTTRPDTGCRMNDRAKRVLLSTYEERMLTLTSTPTATHRTSWRAALHGQAKHLAEQLVAHRSDYRPVLWK